MSTEITGEVMRSVVSLPETYDDHMSRIFEQAFSFFSFSFFFFPFISLYNGESFLKTCSLIDLATSILGKI